MNTERAERLKEKISLLEKFGITVDLVVGVQQISIPSQVDFGWSLEDWASLTRREGYDYVGGCCGAMSCVQDIVNQWWRANDFIRINEIYEVVRAMNQHEGGDKTDSLWQYALTSQVPDTITKLLNSKSELEPWDRVALAWHMLKDFVDLTYDLSGPREDRTEVEQAVATLSQSAHYLHLCSLFRNNDSTEAQRLNDRANTILQVARMRPLLMTVLSNLEHLAGDPVDGFAIEEKCADFTENQKWAICHNTFGIAVFPTEEEAANILRTSQESREQYSKEPRQLRVKQVRIESDGTIHYKDESDSPQV